MPSVRTVPTTDPPTPAASRLVVVAVAAAVAVAALVAALLTASAVLAPPRTVDLVVSNPTGYTVRVVLTTTHGDELPIASVGAGDEERVHDVLDQGEQWSVAFVAQGRVGAEIRLDRASLVSADWRIEVPQELQRGLAAQGVPPPP